jgi:hypothetical protein
VTRTDAAVLIARALVQLRESGVGAENSQYVIQVSLLQFNTGTLVSSRSRTSPHSMLPAAAQSVRRSLLAHPIPAPTRIRRSAFRDCARFFLFILPRLPVTNDINGTQCSPTTTSTCCHKGHRRQYQWRLRISVRTWTDSRTSFVVASPWSRFSPTLQASDLNDSR